jgi:cytochrome P450
MAAFSLSSNICLIVNRPEPAEEVFLTKNKYFDKHPKTGELFKRTAGDSIVFARSDLLW